MKESKYEISIVDNCPFCGDQHSHYRGNMTGGCVETENDYLAPLFNNWYDLFIDEDDDPVYSC